ncbi:DNA-binding protein SMUBP-2 [Holothuria leucospilota]|uniref:DNA-binding protein SMUBP-2 n=1 Tax=Holothuria leucospilota TaxID=206669 RepID=A0A9Q0YD61_HOLLE|nr:DNA-binding protein SMUBP-2 [Holothuria leucospilota]
MAVEFAQKHQALLELEREAEIEEARSILECTSSKQLSVKGVCLPKLHVTNQSTGLYGRTLITLEPSKHHGIASLPANRITTGDIVGLYPSNSAPTAASQCLSGLVWQIRSSKVIIAVENQEQRLDHSALYMLIKLSNDVTYKRLKRALNDLSKSTNSHSSHLQEVLFDEAPLGSPLTSDLTDVTFFNQNLDESQREAVVFALQQREIAVIHGPPGTGKTTTVVEVILQAVKQGQKVVACAPSNVAVDNLVERLATSKSLQLVRIGHPARLLPQIQKFSLDAQLAASDAGRLLQDVRREIDETLGRASKFKQKEERRSTWNELKYLRKELKEREQQALRMILTQADVVLATNTSIADDGPAHLLPEDHFDLVVIDECAQAVEASCWIPLRLARRCVLAGDHKQLPPTIISEKASEEGLAVSLMERVISLHGNKVVKMLSMQYRMHSDIMLWSSGAMYDNQLKAHTSVSSHLLKDLPGVEDNEITSLPMLLIDTLCCDYAELELEDEASKGNEGEANLVVVHVEKLCASGVRPEDIAIITPYNLQVELLRHRLFAKFPGLEIKSVDGFQGREKEAMVMSLVRSNSEGEVGFLNEDRRMNVAVTRARRHFCLICDSQTVSHHQFLKDLVSYINNHGEVHSAFQYSQEVDQLIFESPLPDYLMGREKVKSQMKVKGSKVPPNGTEKKEKKSSIASSTKPGDKDRYRKTKDKTDEEETERIRLKFQKEIGNFMKDRKLTWIKFPTSLNSRDRFLIHEICTEMKLHHESKGEGEDRYIIVSKESIPEQISGLSRHVMIGEIDSKGQDLICSNDVTSEITLKNSFSGISDSDGSNLQNGTENEKSSVDQNKRSCLEVGDETAENACSKNVTENKDGANNSKSISKDKTKERKCRFCGKSLPPGNLILHEIQCEKIQEHKRAEQERSLLKGKMDKSKQKNILEKTKEIDPDELIKLAKKQDGLCNFKKCKEKVLLLGQRCSFCTKRYCLSHHTPEIHGCGELAKIEAHKQRRTDGTQGTKSKKPSIAEREGLHRKLNSKLSDMEKTRQRKGKKK